MTTQNEIKGDTNYFSILDHGFVGLVDSMGTDDSIVQAARVSYGRGTKKVSADRGLIRYLMRHRHTTPFEMVNIKFHCKMPMFVARQWIRHRTASVNEYSARYSIIDDTYYKPEHEQMCEQSSSNNQGRKDEPIERVVFDAYTMLIDDVCNNAYKTYTHMINDSGEKDEETGLPIPLDPTRPMIAREISRMVLPVNYYTEWYWSINLHNLFHFLSLRMDSHAQYEIRVYADAMYDIIKPLCPHACEAFEDYRLEGAELSRMEIEVLKSLLKKVPNQDDLLASISTGTISKRELDEFKGKFGLE